MTIHQNLLAFSSVAFTQTNPTPTVSTTGTGANPNPAFGYIKLKTDGFVYDQDNVQLAAFGSPTGGTNAAGKYWCMVDDGIDPPNYTNMSNGVYVAVGDTYYCGATFSGGLGSYMCNFEIRVADDVAGTNAATGGIATVTAQVL